MFKVSFNCLTNLFFLAIIFIITSWLDWPSSVVGQDISPIISWILPNIDLEEVDIYINQKLDSIISKNILFPALPF
jgi:hypothetical protein